MNSKYKNYVKPNLDHNYDHVESPKFKFMNQYPTQILSKKPTFIMM